MPQHTVCGQGFLRNKQCDNTGGSPILSWPSCIWFLPVHSTEINVEGMMPLWGYWHHREYERGTGKALTRWLPGMFPTPLQSPAGVYSCTRGLFWSKCSLNDFTLLYFSEIKWFQEHFKATVNSFLKTSTMFQRPAWCSSAVRLRLTSCCVAILLLGCW